MNKPRVDVFVCVLVDGDAHKYVGAYKSPHLAHEAARKLGIEKAYIIPELIEDVYDSDVESATLV